MMGDIENVHRDEIDEFTAMLGIIVDNINVVTHSQPVGWYHPHYRTDAAPLVNAGE